MPLAAPVTTATPSAESTSTIVPAVSGAMRIQTDLVWVSSWIDSSPRERPLPDCFIPPYGTDICTSPYVFTHTVPALIARDTRWARARSFVHTPDARPYSTSLAMVIASSSVSNGMAHITGPKISSWAMRIEFADAGEDRRLEEVARCRRGASHRGTPRPPPSLADADVARHPVELLGRHDRAEAACPAENGEPITIDSVFSLTLHA